MVEKSSTCSKSKRKRLKVRYKLYVQRLYKVMLHCHYKILFKNDRKTKMTYSNYLETNIRKTFSLLVNWHRKKLLVGILLLLHLE